ncbi:MAG: glyoxalase [Comamonadaceae bacterium]|nr:MAG: glyoxalase [Comamonadaceae bacterium]
MQDFTAGGAALAATPDVTAAPLIPFHLSMPVKSLQTARHFYGGLLGCPEGRSAEARVDFNFFGHHLVMHLEPDDASHKTTDISSDGVLTPCRHFGVVLPSAEWRILADRLQEGRAHFYSEPQTIFAGQVKEQQIMLVHDGCGNIVEFKGAPPHGLFSTAKAVGAS